MATAMLQNQYIHPPKSRMLASILRRPKKVKTRSLQKYLLNKKTLAQAKQEQLVFDQSFTARAHILMRKY
ncbi:MAG: hypothetical protein ACXAB7_08805 [Candidatus Kariarchaeaceae archaeon]|jgi:hypothetical protein